MDKRELGFWWREILALVDGDYFYDRAFYPGRILIELESRYPIGNWHSAIWVLGIKNLITRALDRKDRKCGLFLNVDRPNRKYPRQRLHIRREYESPEEATEYYDYITKKWREDRTEANKFRRYANEAHGLDLKEAGLEDEDEAA